MSIIAQSISQGRLAGVVSALGIGTGGLTHVLLASASVSIIMLTSPILFLMVKIFDGLYLIYLGGSALLSKSAATEKLSVAEENLTKIYFQRVITNI